MTTRLDKLIEFLEGAAESDLQRLQIVLYQWDALYLARVLRAGQALRRIVVRYDYHAAGNYDAAVGGADDPAQTPD